MRLKFVTAVPIRNGLGEPGIQNNPNWPRYIRTTDIAGPRSLRTDVFASLPPDIAVQASVRPGDILLSAAGSVGKSLLYLSHEPACYAGYLVLVRPKPDVDSRYLAYWTESPLFLDQVETGKVTSTIDNFSAGKYRDLAVPLPPISAQRAIADYLDRETARIDALIEKNQRMISLLEERWATLRRDLTGIGTSRRWGSVQLRRVARLQAGAAFPHEYQGDPTGTIQYVKVGDLASIDGDFRLQGAVNRVTSDVAALLRSPVLPVGTIVLPKIGAALLTNRRAILSEPSCLDQNVMGVTVYEGEPVFVFHALASIDLGELSTPGPVPLLNEDAALSVRIPWPSVGEQRQLVEELNQRRAAILAPSAAIDRQIPLLAEHRQALITAAVTGELEIPGVAA